MARLLYVKGFSPGTTLDQLVIYFQSKDSSGGDIDDESSKLEKDEAIIAFDDEEDLQRVLDREHYLNGSKLEVSKESFANSTPISKPRVPRSQKNKDRPKPEIEKPIIGPVKTIIVSGICPQTKDSTLKLLFENKKRSGGGDIEDFKRTEPDIALITFKKTEDAARVLKKEQVEVDGYLLQLKPNNPEVIFPPDKKKLYLENLVNKPSKENLTNYVELITDIDVKDVVFGKGKNAIVTLEEKPDMQKVIARAKNKPLEGALVKITNPPVCHSILVTGFSSQTTKEITELRFENPKHGGGEILDVVFNQDEAKAVISYYDPNVIRTVTSKKHSLNGSFLNVTACYQFMEEVKMADVAKTKTKVIAVKADVMEHVSNRCNEAFTQSFGFPIEKHTTYDEEKEELTTTMGPNGKPTESQMEDIENYFNNFIVKEIPVSKALLDKSKKEVEQMLVKTTETFPKKAHVAVEDDKLLLIGKKDKLGKIEKALQTELEELEKKTMVVTSNMALDGDKLMLIFSTGFEERFQSKPNIKVKIDPIQGQLEIVGSKEMVEAAKMEALEVLSKVREKYIELNHRQEKFLQPRRLEDLNDGLSKRNVKAIVCLDKSKPKRAKVELLSGEKFDEVNRYVQQQVYEKRFALEEESVALLKEEKWRKFQGELTKNFGIELSTAGTSEMEIWLTGEQSRVEEAYQNLKNFVIHNTIVSELITFPVKGRYLSRFRKDRIKQIEERLKEHLVNLQQGGKEESFNLQGTPEGVRKAKRMLREMVDDVQHRKIVVEEPGMQNFLQTETGKTALTGVEIRHTCTINITDGEEQTDMEVSRVAQLHQPTGRSSVLLCSYDTPQNVALKVYQADITNHRCDVIVNAANGDLQHIGGVAKMIVDRGGQEIQQDCKIYVEKNGRLFAGECYSGIPGRLPCKRIVHAVAPRWDNAQRVKQEIELKYACATSLETAKKYSTIALPALSSGVFGVPKDVCARAMVDAAIKFCSETEGQRALKEIHFVNIDTRTTQTFLKEFETRFYTKPGFIKNNPFQTRGAISLDPGRYSRRQDDFEVIERNPSVERMERPSRQSIKTKTNTFISVVVGDLSTHQADVLVNTTSENLRLDQNPCSRALSNKAGPVLQRQCNAIGKIQADEVAFTDGGNLLCTKVCHVVCTLYNKGQGEKVLRTIIKNSLKQTQTYGLKSIAFPAIGTGILGFPHHITAKICFEECKAFAKENPKSCVKDIHFVVFNEDQASIKAFQDELRKQPEWTQPTAGPSGSGRHLRSSIDESTARKSSPQSNSSQRSGSRETADPAQAPNITEDENGDINIRFQNRATIQVKQGNITEETTDVIAHLSNPDMSMSGGVARAIIRSGGNEIKRQSQKRKPVSKHDVVLTTAGNLKAHYIAHMAGPDRPDPSDIKKCIANCLQEITDQRCDSIAFPAIATGQLNMRPDTSAKAMLTAIIEFLQNNPGSLSTVHIVIHDPEIFKKFAKAVKKLFEEDGGDSPGLLKNIFNGVWNWLKPGSSSTEKTSPAKPEMFLEVCASNPETLGKVAESIDKLTRDQMKRKIIENEEIEKLSPRDVSKIEKIANENYVKVKIEKDIKRIILSGYSEGISAAMVAVMNILHEVKLAEQEKEAAEMVSQGVQWYWTDRDGSQVPYDPKLNSRIEKSHSKKEKSVRFELDEGKCELFFDKMKEINTDTGEETEVVRKELKANADISVPDYWEPQPKDSSGKEMGSHLVRLDPQNSKHNKEYQKISDGFKKTAARHRIQKIERIQNPVLFKLYALRKQSMDERNGSNEQFLYHGTAGTNISDINQHGLNRSYYGVHGIAHGLGVYFAANASVSAGYAKADASGVRRIYVARVAVGQYAVGNSSMKSPPKQGNTAYDSTVDNLTSPSIFVSFYDSQHYPEYLITFR